MSSMEFNLLIDFCILASGIYLIYSAVVMKRSGKIQNMLLSKGVEITKTADVEGFIRSTMGVTIGMGVIGIAAGAIGLYCDYYGAVGSIQLISIVAYFVGLIIYGYLTVRAQKKYLQV